jgi:endonuclease/exonuclease/phosphatase family metal-dependent hydrolase
MEMNQIGSVGTPAWRSGGPRVGARTLALLFAMGALAAGCGAPATLESLPEPRDCRRTSGDPPADWRLPAATEDIHRLNAWCAAVGPAVIQPAAPEASDTAGSTDADASPVQPSVPDTAGERGTAPAPPDPVPVVDTLWVVSWNVHVGGGHLRELVADLRAGRLTGGTPVRHFALLLQEAYRGGDDLPPHDALYPGGSGVYDGPLARDREDIREDARVLGLNLFYAPSMRNGDREDRGNAILSTLPLSAPLAVELPVARQRRVAVSGAVAARRSSGTPWRLRVTSVHLENDADGWVRNEEARLGQGRALLRGLDEDGFAISGGDFNTWTNGRSEAVIQEMRRAHPDTPRFPGGPTYRRGWGGVIRRYLDYIFFRLPEDASASYQRVDRLYNSDHYPLVGRVVFRGGREGG